MAINPLVAANAYNARMQLDDASSTDDADSGPSSGSSFMKMVDNALQDATNAQSKSDAMQMESVTTGKVELSDLVTAVANAELSLNTVVAVRDRVINAYNDIIKMSI